MNSGDARSATIDDSVLLHSVQRIDVTDASSGSWSVLLDANRTLQNDTYVFDELRMINASAMREHIATFVPNLQSDKYLSGLLPAQENSTTLREPLKIAAWAPHKSAGQNAGSA